MDATCRRASTWSRLTAVFLGAILLFTAGTYTNKALQNRSAFLRWREQILQIDDGVNIYERFQYPNPPIMAVLLTPFAHLPPLAGALLWFASKVVMAGASIWAGWRILNGVEPPFPGWAFGLAVLLALRPLVGDLTHGNVNILILFLVSASLFAYHQHREWWSGILLALGICCKVTPLLFVPYFAWKRRWKVLAGVLLGIGAFLFLIPAAWLGWRENLEQLTSWTRQMIVPFVRDGVAYTEHPNQSLPGVAYRLLTRSPSFTVYPGGEPVPAEYHHLAELEPGTVKWLIRAAQAAFLLGMIALCRVPTSMRRGWPVVAEFSFILVGMLILSERTWKHHCVILAWPILVITYAIVSLPWSRRQRRALIIALTVAFALQFSAGSLGGKRFGDVAQVYGVYLISFLILIGLLVPILLKARAVKETAAREPSHLRPADTESGRASGWCGLARTQSTQG